MSLYKTIYYKNDSAFEAYCALFSDGIDPKPRISPIPPRVLQSSTYQKDPDFQSIIKYYSRSSMQDFKFAGIAEEKGGLFNLFQIVLDKSAFIRFLGGLSSSLNTESAYTHGPIFMMTSYLCHSMNTNVYNIPLSHLLFILPTPEMRERFRCLLAKAIDDGLITAEETTIILEKQIFTYTEFVERHCMDIIISPPEEGMGTPSYSDGRAPSELIEPDTPTFKFAKANSFFTNRKKSPPAIQVSSPFTDNRTPSA